ncbi:MAG: hypothetical protein U1A72_00775 [Sulfuritalea sp.]|nr:hypothetical protein [Sulfuritalea sp.]
MATPTEKNKELAVTKPEFGERVEKALDHNKRELMSSMESLIAIHGQGKVMLAMTLTNCPKILKMLGEAGVSEPIRTLVAAQLNLSLTSWRVAAGFDIVEILSIAKGLDMQMSIFEQDLNEAAGGESTTKES